ncbi:MAG TPA: galactokinase [Dehalococcoidia bacterium]|nr:galactokinase [Dehalococcoidia bacterium]
MGTPVPSPGNGARPAFSVAPGRVNLIGEHTDYNEGFVLPAAIDRVIVVAFRVRGDRQMHVRSLTFQEEDFFSLDNVELLPQGTWRNYVRGVASALLEAGHSLIGADLTIQGNVPIGAGLSSSAALEVAVLGGLTSAAELSVPPHEAARLAQEAERRFAGVNCGIMDQMTAVMGRRDHALVIDCRTLEVQAVPLDLERRGIRIVLANTGVARSLSGSAYNERRDECARATAILAEATGRAVRSLRDVTPEDIALHGHALPRPLQRRIRHVVSENGRVLEAADVLRGGDMAAFGELMYASHQSLRDDFEVSCPELDLMVDLTQHLEGVLGARMTGAGFGGCTVNLVREEAVDSFRAQVIEPYRRRTGLAAEMYHCGTADGLSVVGTGDPAVRDLRWD